MTIPFWGDKIAPVAEDSTLKPQKLSTAGDAEAERPECGERKRGAESAEKTNEKSCWQRWADVIIYTSCRLKQTEREAERTEKKDKKVLDKAKEIW